jgi:hypothetical protein
MSRNLSNLYISESFQYLVQISGSEFETGLGSSIPTINITASNAVSSSNSTNSISASYSLSSVSSSYANFAQNSTSASYALTASFALNAGVTVNTASLLVTASATNNTITFTKGDSSTFSVVVATGSAVTVNTGSLMVTGSVNANILTFTKGDGSTFNLTVATGSAVSASFATTASLALNNVLTASIVNATTTFTKGDGSTFSITANNVVNANTASYVLNAVSSSFATNAATANSAVTASYVLNAVSASFATSAATATSASFATSAATATSASFATNANTAISSSFATNANTATSASFATNATSAATASFLPSTTNLNITSISASTAVFQSASIGFLQTITGSVVNIGDSFIVLNTSDATRYAGIKVEDSGSGSPTNYTASFQFDSQTNDWFYEYSGSDPTNFGVAMFGPEYSTIGSPTYLTNNRLSKGNGGHHLNDSTITDDGTNVTFTTPIAGTQISASTGFSGNLTGTASFATNALSASFATNAATASIALSLSGSAENAVSSSYPFKKGDGANSVVSAFYPTSNAANDFDLVLGGSGSKINSGRFVNTIVGGMGSTITGTAGYASGIFSSYESTITAGGLGTTIIGGANNTFNESNVWGGIMLGGYQNTHGANNGYTFMLSGQGNTITTGASRYGGIVGGQSNQLDNAPWSIIVGGSNHSITNDGNVQNGRSVIVGGRYHTINPGVNSVIVGGSNNIIGAFTGSVILGGSNITASASNTVFTPDLIASGSLIVSGTLITTGSLQVSGTLNTTYPTVTGTINNIGRVNFETGFDSGPMTYRDYLWSDTTDLAIGISGYKESLRILTNELNVGVVLRANSSAVFNGDTTIGNALTDNHTVTGSFSITGSLDVTGSVTGNVIGNNTDVYTGSAAIQQVVTLTQNEYNAISASADPNTFYVISDSVGFNSATFATTGSNTFTGNQIINASASADYWLVDTKPFAKLDSNTIVAGRIDGADEDFVLVGRNYNGTVPSITMTDGQFIYNEGAHIFTGSVSLNSTLNVKGVTKLQDDVEITGSLRGNVGTLSISSNTASLDCSTGNFFTLTLVSGSNTFINPSNIAAGQTINLRVTQPNPGNGTVSFPTSVKQVSGSSYVPSVGAGPQDIVTFISFDASSLYLSNVKNLV